MVWRAVQALLADPRIQRVVVAVAPDDTIAPQLLADLPAVQVFHCGGTTRAQTVRAALAQMLDGDFPCEPSDWVLVHDAARPGLPANALARLVDACLAHDRPGLLALPVADTVKRGQPLAENDALASVVQTFVREDLWLAQTPQMARMGMLRLALEAALADLAAGVVPTDESAALERAGHAPLLVRGDARNFKVTWPQDFGLMEKWL